MTSFISRVASFTEPDFCSFCLRHGHSIYACRSKTIAVIDNEGKNIFIYSKRNNIASSTIWINHLPVSCVIVLNVKYGNAITDSRVQLEDIYTQYANRYMDGLERNLRFIRGVIDSNFSKEVDAIIAEFGTDKIITLHALMERYYPAIRTLEENQSWENRIRNEMVSVLMEQIDNMNHLSGRHLIEFIQTIGTTIGTTIDSSRLSFVRLEEEFEQEFEQEYDDSDDEEDDPSIESMWKNMAMINNPSKVSSPPETKECPICYETLLSTQFVNTNCNHSLCYMCVIKSMTAKPICPMCRAEIVVLHLENNESLYTELTNILESL